LSKAPKLFPRLFNVVEKLGEKWADFISFDCCRAA
jgi:hypothetical protein